MYLTSLDNRTIYFGVRIEYGSGILVKLWSPLYCTPSPNLTLPLFSCYTSNSTVVVEPLLPPVNETAIKRAMLVLSLLLHHIWGIFAFFFFLLWKSKKWGVDPNLGPHCCILSPQNRPPPQTMPHSLLTTLLLATQCEPCYQTLPRYKLL